METLHYLKEALTRNWEIKLLALALAIVIYHSMKPAGNERLSWSAEKDGPGVDLIQPVAKP